jgi:hypothetical protein
MTKCQKNRKLFFLSLLFLALLAGVILAVMKVAERKESRYKYADFFKTSKQLDVLFLGSSHVIDGINPVQLYEEYGITSYNMGGHGSMLPETYWELQNALDYCTPKYVVVDAYMLERDFRYLDDAANASENTNVDQLHLNMDVLPVTRTKIDALNDLIQDPKIRRQFLFDFELYHGRWEELTADDFRSLTGNDERNHLMGAEIHDDVDTTLQAPIKTDPADILPAETVGMQYLEKILDTCRARGIQAVVTFLPFASAGTEDMQAAHSARAIASRYGVPFLDLLEANGLINYRTDQNDRAHLNRSGMKKITAYLGSWLHATTDLADHRGEAGYDLWQERAAQYHQEMIQSVMGEEDLNSELMTLSCTSDVSFAIAIRSSSSVFSDTSVLQQIEALSGTTSVEDASKAGGPYFLLYDRKNNKGPAEWAGPSEPDPFDCLLGSVSYIGVPDFQAVYVNGDESHNLLDMEDHAGSDIQILILSNADGSVLSHLCYTYEGRDYSLAQAAD